MVYQFFGISWIAFNHEIENSTNTIYMRGRTGGMEKRGGRKEKKDGRKIKGENEDTK